jgi:hypothetical protein
MELDSRIVVTTNFDKIYENYCESTSQESYKVICHTDTNLGDLLRSEIRLVLKAHGSINNPHNMIFTRSDYHEAKAQYSRFYELLRAVFLTNTCVFIGCGLSDPDIMLLLEDVKITSTSSLPHYALVRSGKFDKMEIEDFESSYNVKALEFGPAYEDLEPNLETLAGLVEQHRIDNPN